MKHWISRNHGFTFIELVVSVGMIALVSIVVVQGFFSTIRSNVKSELIKDVKQNGDVALDVMARTIRNAQSVTSTCSAGGTSSSTISLLDSSSNTITFGCLLDGSIPRIAQTTGAVTNYVTSKNVSLGSDCSGAITFTCSSLPEEKVSIKIEFTLGHVGSSPDRFEQISDEFQTTVTTRQ